MERSKFFITAFVAMALSTPAAPQMIVVKHAQVAMHRLLVARSAAGKIIAKGEFSQVTQGDDVTMRLTYTFLDGSVDDETTTYSQRGTFRLVRTCHVQKGPFFAKPDDVTVEAATGTVTSRTVDKDGKPKVESEHMTLPSDLANGFVGALLLNVPHDAAPFRVGILAVSGKGRLIKVLISPMGEKSFSVAGQTLKATVFRIHPELGSIAGVIAPLVGMKPKDVMVWVLEGADPTVVRIVGQFSGVGPVISSELTGNSFGK
jgi:hypothetical protein